MFDFTLHCVERERDRLGVWLRCLAVKNFDIGEMNADVLDYGSRDVNLNTL